LEDCVALHIDEHGFSKVSYFIGKLWVRQKDGILRTNQEAKMVNNLLKITPKASTLSRRRASGDFAKL